MPFFFSILYFFFGPNPFFFHLFQLFLHIINATLVFLLFRKFFNHTGALLLAIVFLIHPLAVEAVAYISALQDVLFFCFGISALLIFHFRKKGWGFMLTYIFLLLSMLGKETGALFVIILVAYCAIWERKRLVVTGIAGLLTIFVYCFLRFKVAGIAFLSVAYLPISKATIIERLLSMPKIFLYYIQSFFFPKDLAIAQHWIVKKATFSDFFLPLFFSALFFICMAVLGFRVWRHKKQRQYFLFFACWFLLGIFWHMHIFPLSMTVADRWFYFPMVGFLGMLGVIIRESTPILRRKVWVIAIICIVAIVLSIRTVVRIGNWKDNFTLYSHDITIVKDSFDLENGLGVELFKMGNLQEAKMHIERSVQLVALPVNLTNLGIVYKRQGDINRAKEYFGKALAMDGGSYITYEALADLLLFHDRPDAAEQFTKKALLVFPNNPRLWMTLALAQYKLGNEFDATDSASHALSLMNQDEYDKLLRELNK